MAVAGDKKTHAGKPLYRLTEGGVAVYLGGVPDHGSGLSSKRGMSGRASGESVSE